MILDNGSLRVVVDAEAGGAVLSVRHLGLDVEVMARTPWKPVRAPVDAAPDEAAWLARWAGGWPVMFPNAGGAGDGHGFHGEGSTASWDAEPLGGGLLLRRRFVTVPARMARHVALEADAVVLDAEVRAEGDLEAIWGEHVTFGSDLLAGPVTVSTSAASVLASSDYAPPASPLRPGSEGAWPVLPGRDGPVDLSRPGPGWSVVACLADLGPDPWVEVRGERVAVRLEWATDPWPLAWLWVETGGDRDAPWLGRGRCLGVEPCTTWPASGIGAARAASAPLLALRAGEARRARVVLHVFQP